MKRILFCIAVVLVSVFSTLAQRPAPSPPDEQVVRISTDLIQIDATVTDKSGRVVPGLTIADFEVYENGELQKLSNLSFVSRMAGSATAGGSPGSTPGARPGRVLPFPALVSPVSPVRCRRTYRVRRVLPKILP